MAYSTPPNPIGRMFVGGLVAGGTGYLLGPLDALSDPVSAFALGLLFLAGLWSIAHGIFDGFRVLLLLAARRKAETPTGLYGDAAFADLRDCADFGLTDPNGLFLGTLDGVPLFAGGKAHLLTVAPARQGKGTSVVIPNLLHYSGSVFVTDPKGELAAITARHREQTFGHKVMFLNPWKLNGLPCDRYNPLQPLIDMAADPRRHYELGDAARANAFMLEPEPEGGDKNRFFRDGERNILEAMQLHLATRGRPARCTLPELWRIIKNSDLLELTLREMAESDALDGVVAAYGSELLKEFLDGARQFEDFRNGASNALQVFRPGGPLADAVSGTDARFEELKTRPTTVYVMIPAERISA